MWDAGWEVTGALLVTAAERLLRTWPPRHWTSNRSLLVGVMVRPQRVGGLQALRLLGVIPSFIHSWEPHICRAPEAHWRDLLETPPGHRGIWSYTGPTAVVLCWLLCASATWRKQSQVQTGGCHALIHLHRNTVVGTRPFRGAHTAKTTKLSVSSAFVCSALCFFQDTAQTLQMVPLNYS